MAHPTIQQVIEDAFNDEEEMKECRSSWEAYKFYHEHGYNSNIPYAAFNEAWEVWDEFYDLFDSITEVCEKTTIQNHLWYLLSKKTYMTSALNEDNLPIITEYMKRYIESHG